MFALGFWALVLRQRPSNPIHAVMVPNPNPDEGFECGNVGDAYWCVSLTATGDSLFRRENGDPVSYNEIRSMIRGKGAKGEDSSRSR